MNTGMLSCILGSTYQQKLAGGTVDTSGEIAGIAAATPIFQNLLNMHTDFNCLIYSPISVVHIFQFLLVKRFAVSKLEPMFALGFIRVHFCGLPTSCPTRKSLLRPAKSWGNLGKFNWTLNTI